VPKKSPGGWEGEILRKRQSVDEEGSTERCTQNRTQIVFLSFPLLLCLKLVADASPHHGAGTTFHTRPPSCSLADPKDLIASNKAIDLIKPLGSASHSYWNELDVIYCRRRGGTMVM